MAAPTSLLTSRLTFPLWTPHTHTYLPLQTPRLTSSYLSSISFSEPPASTHLFHWLSLNLFHILPEGVISGSSVAMCLHYRGIHFMSIYLLVEHHQRVWWIWTEKKKKKTAYSTLKKMEERVLSTLSDNFSTWIRVYNNNCWGGIWKKWAFHTMSSLKKTLQTTKDAYLIAMDDKWRYHPDPWPRMAATQSKVFHILRQIEKRDLHFFSIR